MKVLETDSSVGGLALLLRSCINVQNYLTVLQFSHLLGGRHNSLMGLLKGLNELISVNGLAQCLAYTKGLMKVSYSHHQCHPVDQRFTHMGSTVPPSRQFLVESGLPD